MNLSSEARGAYWLGRVAEFSRPMVLAGLKRGIHHHYLINPHRTGCPHLLSRFLFLPLASGWTVANCIIRIASW